MSTKSNVIFKLYFALISFVTLMIIVGSIVTLINLGFTTYIFPDIQEYRYSSSTYCNELNGNYNLEKCNTYTENEREEKSSRNKQTVAYSLSMLIVAIPLFFLHFIPFYRDWKRSRKEN